MSSALAPRVDCWNWGDLTDHERTLRAPCILGTGPSLTQCKNGCSEVRSCQIFSYGRVAIRTLLVSHRWNCHTCKFSLQSCVPSWRHPCRIISLWHFLLGYQGVVTSIIPVEALDTGISNPGRWKLSMIAWCSLPKFLITWFYKGSKDKTVATPP